MELTLKQQKEFREYLEKRFSLSLSQDYEDYFYELFKFIRTHYRQFISESILVAHHMGDDPLEAKLSSIECLYNGILWDYLEESEE